MSAGSVHNLAKSADASARQFIPLNDALFLPNFKGISGIGSQQKTNLSADKKRRENVMWNMGLERFMQFNLKITQVDTPILSRYEIEPFVFANMALVRPQGVNE